MKKLTLLSAFVFMTALVFGQWNAPDDEHLECNHAKGQHAKGSEAVFYFQDDLLFDYDVKFYFLDIEVDPNTTEVGGNVTIHAEVVSSTLDTLVLEYLTGNTMHVNNRDEYNNGCQG